MILSWFGSRSAAISPTFIAPDTWHPTVLIWLTIGLGFVAKCSSVYQTKVRDLCQLKQRLIDAWRDMGQSIIDYATDKRRKRLCAWFVPETDILSKHSVLSSWTVKGNWCYWVKYVSFSAIFYLCISPGSGITHLKCGEKHVDFVANFLLSSAVKEFWKSVNICPRIELHVFFTHSVYLTWDYSITSTWWN